MLNTKWVSSYVPFLNHLKKCTKMFMYVWRLSVFPVSKHAQSLYSHEHKEDVQ